MSRISDGLELPWGVPKAALQSSGENGAQRSTAFSARPGEEVVRQPVAFEVASRTKLLSEKHQKTILQPRNSISIG